MIFSSYNFKNQKIDIDKLYEVLEFATLDFGGAFEPDKTFDPIIDATNVVQPTIFLGDGRLISVDEKIQLTPKTGATEKYLHMIKCDTTPTSLNLSTQENSNISYYIEKESVFTDFDINNPNIVLWDSTHTTFYIVLAEDDGGAITPLLKNLNKKEYIEVLSDGNYQKLMDFIYDYCAFAKKDGSGEENYNLGNAITYEDNGTINVANINVSSMNVNGAVYVEDNTLKSEQALSVSRGGTGGTTRTTAKSGLGFYYGTVNPETTVVPQDPSPLEGDVYFRIV